MPVVSPGASPISPTAFAPQLAGLVSTVPTITYFNSFSAGGANAAHGVRVVIPRDGTLHDFALLSGGALGNYDVGIYDYVAEPRARLWSSGPVAAGPQGWQIVGDPNLAVTQGEILDFVFATDGATTQGCMFAADVNMDRLPSANFWPVPNGSQIICWSVAASYPLPATFADAALANEARTYCMMARVT